jgi:hypothetical protein
MEIHKTTNKQLNDLFNEARQEKPVMNLKEVDQIIKEGKYTPSAGSRGFHIGMNNLIVVCGIVVSSFLAYMALKVDHGDLDVAANHATVDQSAQTSQTSPTSQSTFNDQTSASNQSDLNKPQEVNSNADQLKKEPALKASDRVQPKQNPSTLLASADHGIAVSDVSEKDNDEDAVTPVSAKMPSGEYVITFNYAGQDISMKLVGDEVSELNVDGHEIPENQYGDFDDILAEGKNYLIGNTHSADGSSSLNLIKYFDGQLRADKILDSEVQYKFELSSSELIVNGEVQNNDVFKKYKGLYESKTGKTITAGSVYKFERGAKSE